MKMKKLIITTMAAGLMASVASAEVSVTADFATAYVFRGVTFNNGFVIQPGIEAGGLGLPEKYGSVAVGAWGNYDVEDYGGNLDSSEFSEVDWYGSYSLPTFVEDLDLFVGYTEYTYPNAADDADKEAALGAGYEIMGIGVGATWYRGIGGEVSGDNWFEGSIGYGFDISEDLAVGVAADVRFLDSRDGDSGWNDYTIGGDIGYVLNDVWSIGASLTYIGQCDSGVLADETTNDPADPSFGYSVDMVGMFSVAASF
jgi:uncharacterized protein (TIGR02001 family)